MTLDEMKLHRGETEKTEKIAGEFPNCGEPPEESPYPDIKEITPEDENVYSDSMAENKENLFLVREQARYRAKRQGEYTLEDYYAFPDECRLELIDGVIYDMSSPTSIHQLISMQIGNQLYNYISGKGGSCIPLIAPVDVRLDCDNRTMVQPDVLVLCDREKLTQKCIYGAPDFVIEILSKSTRKKDMLIKLNKYTNAGVREYWMVDPDRKTVIVYDFAHEDYMKLYGFHDTVPVGIFDGDCRIDFAKMNDYISFMYEKEEAAPPTAP